MRPSLILIAVVATLVATCSGVSASEPSPLSRMDAVDITPLKTSRFLRKVKVQEESEERLTLEKIDDILARLGVAEANMLATLNKFDDEIFNGAEARIQRWKEAEWNPTYVATMLRRDYPTLSPNGRLPIVA
ncbi:putative secreted RxLR effector protein [Phytophthora cinnamomi]|uniref:putative secreted RxLR effector protein n=1 Tax=Phytophthora cinnamomi TaxID=4785 RepID=UPI003559D5DB|nr:putative secreted RxLR effector protein [Phytophthora cinnamomi]